MARSSRCAGAGAIVAAVVAVAAAFTVAACGTSEAEEVPAVKLPGRVPLAEGGADAEGGAVVDSGTEMTDAGADTRDAAPGVGCSDGKREGFTAIATYPNIAACAGAWSIAGLLAMSTTSPACSRRSGNDSTNPNGIGCNVADLCQEGWHVCVSATEVGAKSGGAGCAAASTPGAFFVTRQSGPGGGQCGVGANDVFGCGDVGLAPDAVTCGPLTRFSNDLCLAVPALACGADGLAEANNVTKATSAGGGVLCCRD